MQWLAWEADAAYRAPRQVSYQHFRASISLPGVSRHLRMTEVCCRTATKASSRRRAWSSGGAGVAMMQLELLVQQQRR